MKNGYVHSIESMGTLDGPGIRTVIFFQGCPLKCIFCHNIDTNIPNQGKQYSVDELFEKVIKNKEYWEQNDGGITLSGGEPFAQPEYVLEFAKKLKDKDIHIVMDTCLKTTKKNIESFLRYIDLWMISIKEFDNKKHTELTSSSNEDILENVKFLDDKISELNLESNIRIRFVVIPGITDYDELIEKLGDFCYNINNFESLELLPYWSQGKNKWYEIYGEYKLENVRDGTKEDLQKFERKLKHLNLNIKY